ncbi:MAG: pullulanase-type alpha-1,6-glucosidase [Anaerolineae bacterium]
MKALGLLLWCALIIAALAPIPSITTLAQDVAQPKAVALIGSLAVALGCESDNQPDCAATQLTFNEQNQLWQGSFEVPAGDYEYSASIDGPTDKMARPPIKLSVSEAQKVDFYFNRRTMYLADNVNRIIANVPGSFQLELGCPNTLGDKGDWAPNCLRTLLEDPDGDGIYVFSTNQIPQGNYEAKVAVNGTWNENYGGGGAPGGSNIGFSAPKDGLNIIFTWDSQSKVMEISIEGAPKGNISLAQAHWVARDTIAWSSLNVNADSVVTLYYDPVGAMTLELDGLKGGTGIPLTYDPAGLSAELKEKFPNLANAKAFKLPADVLDQVPEILKCQLAITAVGTDGKIADLTSLQILCADDVYHYEGALGVTFDAAVPTLRVWAPTAVDVKLHVFDDSKVSSKATNVLPMTFDPVTGVWSVTGEADWKGKFYLYEVNVFVRSTGKIERNLVTDPYSFNLSADSLRSQIIDLNDPALAPEGWDAVEKPVLVAPEDIVIYELHVRDFSIYDQSVPEDYRGRYMAFTAADSDGMKHLEALQEAGLTHIHLLPVFDIATIREKAADRTEPPMTRLREEAADSDAQQALVGRGRGRDGFNWGYDPLHYTVPEGSYATNPDGTARIIEFRSMVEALNKTGLRVIMDVVYNHTNASGQGQKSVLDRIVPGYYHRLNGDGNVENSTCCANTASEHHMMEKLMVDSVVTWATEYKVDGFRFDLMGHHMVSNMVAVRKALDALTLEKDGVDGSKIYVYGEGWDFGEVAKDARGVNATQLNLPGTGIGTFSDRLRDGVRGGGPFDDPRAQGFASGLYTDPNDFGQGTDAEQKLRLLNYQEWVRLGLAGNLADYQLVNAKGETVTGKEIDYKGAPAGYTLDPQEQIIYVSAHDNETLFDAIAMKLPTSLPLVDRIRMHNLGLSVAMFSQGVVFIHAGDDVLRSKSMDRDSYDSGDWFNAIDWTLNDNGWGHGLPIADKNQDKWDIMRPLLADPALKPTHDEIEGATQVFQDFLRIRKSSPLFRLTTAEQVMAKVSFLKTGAEEIPGVVVLVLDDSSGEAVDPTYSKIVVVFNATPEEQTISDEALKGLNLTLHPVQANGADAVVKGSAVMQRRDR